MSSAGWDRVSRAFGEALELEGAQREQFLAKLAEGDAQLHDEVIQLLASLDRADRFLVKPLLSSDTETAEGEQIGSYRVIERIGEGGMGVVFLAERTDDVHDRRVALKIVKRGMDSEEILQRFHNERRILAQLEHPNIARFLDGGTTPDGRPFFVMQHVDGRDLLSYLNSERLDLRRRLELFCRICQAVNYAHQNLIVHRDLKPSNILIDGSGEPRLLDFGIAKLLEEDPRSPRTRSTMRPMTPRHASPEQVRGEAITTASDVYGLGVLLYHLLTGASPHGEAAGTDLERSICEETPERPSTVIRRGRSPLAGLVDPGVWARRLSGDLDQITLQALEKEPARRYPSALALSEDLHRHLEGLPVHARRGTLVYRSLKFVGRHRMAVAAAIAFVALAVAAASTQWMQSRRIARESLKAQSVSAFLVELFENADPFKVRAAELTVREALDSGRQRLLDGELEEAPLVRAELLDAIAKVYRSLGLDAEAAEFFQLALETQQSSREAEPLDVAVVRNELAHTFFNQGRYERAAGLLKDSIAEYRALLGSESPQLARGLNDLGTVLHGQARFDEAEAFYRQALAMRTKLFGEEHELVAETLLNLGGIHERRGRGDEAVDLYRRGLEILRQSLGDDHPRLAGATNNLAYALYAENRLAEAEKLFWEALDRFEKGLGQEHPHVAFGLNNLAATLRDQGKLDEAEPLQRRALELTRRHFGAEHPSVATNLNNLATLLARLDRGREAEALWQEALALRRRVLGKEHPGVAAIQVQLAELAIYRQQWRRAETAVRTALPILAASLGSDSWQHAHAFGLLGECLYRQGEVDEGHRLLRQGAAALAELLGDEHPKTREAQQRLDAADG